MAGAAARQSKPLVEQLNLLASARYAEYAGSGGIWAWKYGLDWQVISDLRLRGTVSRDVRAATLLGALQPDRRRRHRDARSAVPE